MAHQRERGGRPSSEVRFTFVKEGKKISAKEVSMIGRKKNTKIGKAVRREFEGKRGERQFFS